METGKSMINQGCSGKTEKPRAYSDVRFQVIHDKAREIKGLIREVNEISHHKFGELLGACPSPDCNKTAVEHECWADRVIYEQDITITILRDTLERIHSV